MPGLGPHGAQLGNEHRILASQHTQCPEPAKAHAALAWLDTGSQHRAECPERDGEMCVRGITTENIGLRKGKLRLL